MIRKLFSQMVFTQVVSCMAVTLCMLIDSIVIGRFLGVDAMAAYGYTQPVLLAFAAPGAMISAGVQVVCGKTLGSGDMDGTNSCFTLSAVITALISLFGLVIVLTLSGPISTLLGAGAPGSDNAVYYLTKDYLTGFIIGLPAFLTAQIMIPYLQMAGSRIRLVIAVLVMTAFDILLDLLNAIFVHGGIFGMGLSSSISYYAAVAIGLGYFLKKESIFRFRWKNMRYSILRDTILNGIPTVINQLSLVFLVLLLNHLLSSMEGNHAVAAYSVIATVSNMCYAFCNGNSQVALMMASIFHSDEDRSSLYELVRVMRKSAVVLLFFVTLLVMAFGRPVVALFLADEPETISLATLGLRLFSLSLVPCALNTTFKFYYQGIGKIRLMETISVLQNFVLPFLAALLLGFVLKTTGVWMCFVCGESAAWLFICAYVWIHNRRVGLAARDWALLPASFGVSEGNCFEFSVGNVNDAVNVSDKAVDFCLAHGEDKTKSVMIGLCIEEITCNTVIHGFSKGNGHYTVDVRLMFCGNEKKIRIRDNCLFFDPVHYYKLHRGEDPVAHLGIRTVISYAREAVYLNTLGLNNLMLTL
ncbi:MAG: hypothetical protein E7300_05175 [Lachnospiraceae bacterium]|nr:hypothetical protein [Lachnospiraceae bacterium]